MDEMVRYVFRNMKETEISIKMLKQALARQSKINSAVNLSLLAFMVYLIVQEKRRRAQDEKIEMLEKKMEGRKGTEGA